MIKSIIKDKKPRYTAESAKGHIRDIELEIYPYLVWDCEEKTFVALASSEPLALNYAAQINERGFIEP